MRVSLFMLLKDAQSEVLKGFPLVGGAYMRAPIAPRPAGQRRAGWRGGAPATCRSQKLAGRAAVEKVAAERGLRCSCRLWLGLGVLAL